MSEISEKEIQRRFQEISNFTISPETTTRDLERVRRNLAKQCLEPQGMRPTVWRTLMNSRSTKPAAAAAIFVGALVGISLFNVTGSSIAWANVVEHIRTVKTMSYAWRHAAVTNPGGDSECVKHLKSGRVYMQDPGKHRFEMLDARGEVEQIVITLSSATERSTLVYNASEGQWHKSMISSIPADRDELYRTEFLWRILEGVTSAQATRIGETTIDGRAAIGFRVVLPEETIGSQPLLASTFEVWVDRVTAVPVQVVAIFQQDRQRQVDMFERLVMQNIQWNTPLAATLFRVPEGTEIDEIEHRQVLFTRTHLKDGVTVWVGPKEGPPVVTETDVSKVPYGETSIERNGGRARYKTSVYLELNQDGEARLRRHTKGHINEKLVIEFNGEIVYEPTIQSEIGSRFIIVLSTSEMLDEHGSLLKEFEETYLRE